MGFKLGQGRGPSWHDITLGIRVQIAPYDAADYARARQATIDARGFYDVADGAAWQFEFNMRLAAQIICDWSGIWNAEGEPAELEEDAVFEVYCRCPKFADYFDLAVSKAHKVAEEKNDSSAAQNGNGAAAGSTAKSANRPKRRAQKAKPSMAGDAHSASTSH